MGVLKFSAADPTHWIVSIEKFGLVFFWFFFNFFHDSLRPKRYQASRQKHNSKFVFSSYLISL